MTTDTATQLVRVDPSDVADPDEGDARSALAHYTGTGDVSRLASELRAALYLEVCRSIGINPRTRPFDWIEFYDPETKAKKLFLYPNKTCTDQLAYVHKIRIRTIEEKMTGTLYKVRLEGTMPDGRVEENVAYLDLTDSQGQPLRGQKYGNALMKAHTKAKRRLVLGMVGMSVPDIETMPRARTVTLDGGGNIIERPTQEQRALAERPAMAQAIGEETFEDHADVVTGFEAEPTTLPRPDPGPPPRTGPRPSFTRSAEDVNRLLGAWFAAVGDTSLRSDDARARYVSQWTKDEWPENKRTDSLRTFFARATDDEAGDLLAHTRAIVEGEKLARQAGSQPEMEPPDEEVEPF